MDSASKTKVTPDIPSTGQDHQFGRPVMKKPIRDLDRRPLPPRPVQKRMRPELKQHTEVTVSKPAPKVMKAEPKLVKVASKVVFTSFAQPKVVKVQTKVAKVEAKAVKPVQKKSEDGKAGNEEKAVKALSKLKQPHSKPPVQGEPNADGCFELNSLMARMVDSELQNVMMKVWQELPEELPSEAEKLVVDKFKNDAGEHLRNVLGLNVTKRLLNIFNPLFVKVQFNRKPEETYLKKFIRACNCVAMKKFRNDDCTYVAQIRSVVDFDRVCSMKRLRCGEARATVIPCYKFTQCPPKVKTVYNKEIVQETKENNDKIIEQSDNNSQKIETVQSVPKNNEITSQVEKNGDKPEQQESTNNTTSGKPSKKEDGNENNANATEAAKKSDSTEKSVNTKPVTASTANKSDAAKKPDTVKKSDEKHINSKPVASKVVAASSANRSDATTKLDTTAAKNSNKKPVASKLVNKVNTMAKKKELSAQNKEKKPPNDYDELDDEDILALISDGIVLDQCSGSDDE